VPLEFGTDGVRGVANVELTPEYVFSLGRAAARLLGGRVWYLGRDTRASGPGLSAALAAGLSAEGAEVVDLGVVPTPAVAFVSEQQMAPAAVISASHNPFSDNGVKLFAAGGRKLADDVEAALEAEMGQARPAAAPLGGPVNAGSPADVGQGWIDRYLDLLVAGIEGRRLDGLRLVVDCAHGAASVLAPIVLSRVGAEVTVLHADPNGTNINAGCGSTYPDDLRAAVREARADGGLAFDGDADRVLAVDDTGDLVDGDQLLSICAADLQARGALASDTVVVTVMANLGLRLAMAGLGISVVETSVGDRYVLEALERQRLSLGGEQSGHIIFRDVATTGDGLLTGLRVFDIVRRSGRSLHDLATSSMTRLPQVLRSVGVAGREGLAEATQIWEEVATVEAELGERGRVLLRLSGTEPVVRVMVEAPTQGEAERAADRLCRSVAAALGTAAATPPRGGGTTA
jgi:phosphoglucosamine mutase